MDAIAEHRSAGIHRDVHHLVVVSMGTGTSAVGRADVQGDAAGCRHGEGEDQMYIVFAIIFALLSVFFIIHSFFVNGVAYLNTGLLYAGLGYVCLLHAKIDKLSRN